MKNRNLFLCFVLVLVISVVLVGCGSNTSNENGGKSDTGKVDSQAWNDPSKPQDQTWSDPENYESQSWSDPENYDDQDWRDPENPGTEAADPGESDHAGMYRHEIDGIVFYTEHDVAQWIGHQDGLGMTFNLEQMAKDLFTGKQSFGRETIPEEWIYSFDGETVIALSDPYTTNFALAYTLNNADFDGHTSLQAKPGVYPYLANGTTYVYDLGKGTDDEEYYKPYYFLNGSYHCTDYEMLEIALYAAEKWASGEYYDFENFNSSSRIWVYRH